MIFFFVFYGCMKILQGEPISKITYLLTLLAIMFWIPAMMFFALKEASVRETPAISRNKNQPCVFLIYSNHDLWHFLSAGGYFCTFLILLVIDDGISDKAQSEILIF